MRQLSNAQVAYCGRQILRWPPMPMLFYNRLPLSVSRALICLLPIEFGKGDRISFLWFHYVMWQRWRDFTDIIKISNQLSVNSQKRDYPGWVWPNQISPLKDDQEVRDSKEQILLCWLCRSKLPESYRFKEMDSARWAWERTLSLDDTLVPGDTLTATLWDPVQRARLIFGSCEIINVCVLSC